MNTKLKFYLETNHPIATDSYDYLYPYGAIRDNFRNPKFNQKLYHFPGAILDLGCAGGGFVKNCLEDQDWWLNQLSLNGFGRDETIEQFFDCDWVRNEFNSYHLVLRQK